ncbi:hypothetical protein FB45DRAFT_914216 [Roridomyces roridus]|uniref:Uncharacterized protein n=1 Tax=Roridomyces roridus TaxID=1738132 RepID=A0AAD7BXI6_9AGAR|nr:hypothetical protein FB45DRAFT_914216 [Roridomyces roridus]
MHPIMETFLREAERWEEVYLDSPSCFTVDVLSKAREDLDAYNFPLLRRFNCTAYEFCSEYPDGAVFQSIPFAQLDRYQEYVCSWHMDPERLWKIVSQLAQADTLRIAIPSASESVIKLPRLRSAFLAVDTYEATHLTMDQVLACFDMPQVEFLYLDIPRSSFIGVDVLCPVPKQFQNLKALRLCGSQQVSNGALTCILSHIGTLTDFGIELYYTNTDARHLLGLLRPKPNSILLPRLQALRITPPGEEGIVDELLGMLRERFGGVKGLEFSRLRLFSVYHPASRDALPDAILDELQSLKAQEGWDIRVDQRWHGDFWENEVFL